MAFRGGNLGCPRRAAHFFDLDTGERFALACGSLNCPYCVETQIWRAGIALEYAAPERYAVFTNVPDNWPELRASINRFHQILDRSGRVWNDCYTAERGDKTGMLHLNMWQHGDFIPQAELCEIAGRVGWGSVVDIRKWTPRGGQGYGMKEGSGRTYGMKEGSGKGSGDQAPVVPAGALTARQRAYLDRNGGRLLHARRGYWRDGATGETLGSKHKVLERALTSIRGPKVVRDEWVVLMGSELVANSRVPVLASAIPTAPIGDSTTAARPLSGSPAASDPSPAYLDFPGF